MSEQDKKYTPPTERGLKEDALITAAKILAEAIRPTHPTSFESMMNAVDINPPFMREDVDLSGNSAVSVEVADMVNDHIKNSSLYAGTPAMDEKPRVNMEELKKLVSLGYYSEDIQQKDWAFRHIMDILDMNWSTDKEERIDG